MIPITHGAAALLLLPGSAAGEVLPKGAPVEVVLPNYAAEAWVNGEKAARLPSQ